MKTNLKKITAVILLFVAVSCIFAKSKRSKTAETPANTKSKAPVWASDAGRLKMFPQGEYISALGVAFNADAAKNKAAQAISSYIKTEVTAMTQSRYKETEKNGKANEEKSIDEEITLLTDQEIYALDYTETWRDDDTTEYYCVAFVDKSVAWNRIKPKLNTITADIESKMETADEDNTGFWRTITLGEILAMKKEFYALYDFAVIVNPNGAKAYVPTEESFRVVEQTVQLEKPKQTVWLTVNNDKNGMVYRAIASSLESKGFTVSSSRGKYVATADVTVSIRQEGDNFVSYPGITVEVKSAVGSQVASFSYTGKKTVGFEKAALEEKAYRTLEKAADEIFVRK